MNRIANYEAYKYVPAKCIEIKPMVEPFIAAMWSVNTG